MTWYYYEFPLECGVFIVVFYKGEYSMKDAIVFDLDGVIYDINKLVAERVKESYPNFSMNRVLTYDFNKSLENIPEWLSSSAVDTEEYDNRCCLNAPRNVIFSHYSDSNLFLDCPIMPDAVDVIRELGKDFVIIFNSYAVNDAVKIAKLERICADFNSCKDLSIAVGISSGEPKKSIFGAKYVIDDSIEELKKYENSNTNLILKNHSYNTDKYNKKTLKSLGDFSRVYNLSGLLDVCKLDKIREVS